MGSQSQTQLSNWTEPSFLLSFGLGLSGFCQYQTGREKVRGKLMSGNQAKHLVAPTTCRPHLLCWEHCGVRATARQVGTRLHDCLLDSCVNAILPDVCGRGAPGDPQAASFLFIASLLSRFVL